MGVTEEEFYDSGRVAIAPMAFCFPGYDGKSPTGKGGDLPPPAVCAEIWRAEVMAVVWSQLQVVLLVGAYAQAWHLGKKRGRTLTETVGGWRERVAETASGEPLIMPLPHPSWRNNAWLKKNPWFEADVLPTLRLAVRQALK
ncbi:uracil-DNA glycosylase [Parvularcula dongshanensis]|uniref:Uracil-DNA glycosylase n=2 Tax=Parvularcula dongshanensis TaxID=1173995 RepID=A0A840I472_9PROT|nr:uracil-DNA glycosylase [Parvularcula dongshanensis]